MEPMTATQIMADQSRHRLQATMHRLLHRMKQFVRVYPLVMDDTLPDHDIIWETTIDGGPDRALLDAIKSNPLLWREALPSDVVIVPRKMLEKVGLHSDVIDAMAGHGNYLVEATAARYEHDLRKSA